MIARAIVREAQHCEEPLLSFALSSPKHPSLSNRSTVGAEAASRDPAGLFTVYAPANRAFAKLPAARSSSRWRDQATKPRLQGSSRLLASNLKHSAPS